MKTLTFTDDEWRDLIEWVTYMSDESYALRIANMIADKVEKEE